MAKKRSKKTDADSKTENVLRFAHPFFTNTPPDQRPEVPGVGTRMTDFISTKLEKIPTPQREPTMTLAEIIGNQGVKDIENAKSISFHATGDTGDPQQDMQDPVALAMAADYNIASPTTSPAFFLHLGDVIYYENTDQGYHKQFYVPYKTYPGKIIAIPGNHDGELFQLTGASTGQKKTLEAFLNNFCLPKPSVPPAAGTIYREMVSQPGVYWLLRAPFVDIIGLYSNVAEGPGYIAAPQIGQKQKTWLGKTLKALRKERDAGARKALLLAVHHPPFSNGGHEPSTAMLADIDDACTKSGLMPDAVLAGHSHNYQRYTRFVTFGTKALEIPFIVAGCGGHNTSTVKAADGSKAGDHAFVKSLEGYGYLTVTVTASLMTIQFMQVEKTKKHAFDQVVVNLKTNKVQ